MELWLQNNCGHPVVLGIHSLFQSLIQFATNQRSSVIMRPNVIPLATKGKKNLKGSQYCKGLAPCPIQWTFFTQKSSLKTIAYYCMKDQFPLLCWTPLGDSDANGCRRKQWTSSSDGSREAGVWARCCGCVSAICSYLPGRPERCQTLAQQLWEPSCMVGKSREARERSKSSGWQRFFRVITTVKASLSKSIKTCCQDLYHHLYFGLLEIKNLVFLNLFKSPQVNFFHLSSKWINIAIIIHFQSAWINMPKSN